MKISVIVPAYNAEEYIEEAIVSVIQSCSYELEVVAILDNRSTDKTSEKLVSLSQKLSNLVLLDANKRSGNVASMLNLGLQHSRYSLIARQDADDISMPGRLDRQLEYMVRTGIDLVGCDYVVVDSEGRRIRRDRKSRSEAFTYNGDPMLHGTWLFSKKAILDFGGYNEAYRYGQDTELLRRISKEKPTAIGKLRKQLYCWRETDSQVTNVHSREQSQFILNAVKSIP